MRSNKANGGAGSHALVIGIDDYPLIRANPLEGCRNDAQRMAALLEDVFGFAVHLLLDTDATRAGILAAMSVLEHAIRPGDRVVFHFSGHGSCIESPEAPAIETLVPQNSGRGKHPNRDITDEEVYQWVMRVSAVTPFLTLIFDSCHAGGIVRDLEASARGVAPDRRPEAALTESACRALDLDGGRGLRGKTSEIGSSGWLPRSDRYTLLAACKKDQRAREIKDPLSGEKHGAFTYYLAKTLADTTGACSYRDVFERVSASLVARFREQAPQLEGIWDRQIFGVADLPAMRFAPVTSRQGERITLGAGAAHGLRLGSECVVYPRGTRQPRDSEILGRIRVNGIALLNAEAELTEEISPGAIDAGGRAVEVARPIDVAHLAVSVVGEGTAVERLRRTLAHAPLLKLTDRPQDADYTVFRLAARDIGEDDAPDSLPVPQLGPLGRDTWAATDGCGRLVMPPRPASSPEAIDRIRRDLEVWARHRALLALDTRGSDRSLHDALEVELLHKRAGSDWRPAQREDGGHHVFHEGDLLGLRIRHQHTDPLYVTVLDLGLTGAIHLLHPVRGAAQALATGHMLEIGMDEDDPIQLFVPEVLPFAGETYDEQTETLVILITTDEDDLSLLSQTGIRGLLRARHRSEHSATAPASSGQLSTVLWHALSGVARRDARPLGDQQTSKRWTVEHHSFRLRRARLSAP